MSRSGTGNCVLFFVKYPENGLVKTRLCAEIGKSCSLELYRCFVLDLLTTLKLLGTNLQICFYPRNCRNRICDWLGGQYNYLSQTGSDLGQRMKNAFKQVFQNGCQRAIVIGSDSPDLPLEFLQEAFLALDTNDVVIGPCTDGGYYLIGFSKKSFLPDVFESIDWSTERVFEKTCDRLTRKNRSIYTLEKWFDIDTARDLRELISRNSDKTAGAEKTMACLSEFKGIIKNGN